MRRLASAGASALLLTTSANDTTLNCSSHSQLRYGRVRRGQSSSADPKNKKQSRAANLNDTSSNNSKMESVARSKRGQSQIKEESFDFSESLLRDIINAPLSRRSKGTKEVQGASTPAEGSKACRRSERKTAKREGKNEDDEVDAAMAMQLAELMVSLGIAEEPSSTSASKKAVNKTSTTSEQQKKKKANKKSNPHQNETKTKRRATATVDAADTAAETVALEKNGSSSDDAFDDSDFFDEIEAEAAQGSASAIEEKAYLDAIMEAIRVADAEAEADAVLPSSSTRTSSKVPPTKNKIEGRRKRSTATTNARQKEITSGSKGADEINDYLSKGSRKKYVPDPDAHHTAALKEAIRMLRLGLDRPDAMLHTPSLPWELPMPSSSSSLYPPPSSSDSFLPADTLHPSENSASYPNAADENVPPYVPLVQQLSSNPYSPQALPAFPLSASQLSNASEWLLEPMQHAHPRVVHPSTPTRRFTLNTVPLCPQAQRGERALTAEEVTRLLPEPIDTDAPTTLMVRRSLVLRDDGESIGDAVSSTATAPSTTTSAAVARSKNNQLSPSKVIDVFNCTVSVYDNRLPPSTASGATTAAGSPTGASAAGSSGSGSGVPEGGDEADAKYVVLRGQSPLHRPRTAPNLGAREASIQNTSVSSDDGQQSPSPSGFTCVRAKTSPLYTFYISSQPQLIPLSDEVYRRCYPHVFGLPPRRKRAVINQEVQGKTQGNNEEEIQKSKNKNKNNATANKGEVLANDIAALFDASNDDEGTALLNAHIRGDNELLSLHNPYHSPNVTAESRAMDEVRAIASALTSATSASPGTADLSSDTMLMALGVSPRELLSSASGGRLLGDESSGMFEEVRIGDNELGDGEGEAEEDLDDDTVQIEISGYMPDGARRSELGSVPHAVSVAFVPHAGAPKYFAGMDPLSTYQCVFTNATYYAPLLPPMRQPVVTPTEDAQQKTCITEPVGITSSDLGTSEPSTLSPSSVAATATIDEYTQQSAPLLETTADSLPSPAVVTRTYSAESPMTAEELLQFVKSQNEEDKKR